MENLSKNLQSKCLISSTSSFDLLCQQLQRLSPLQDPSKGNYEDMWFWLHQISKLTMPEEELYLKQLQYFFDNLYKRKCHELISKTSLLVAVDFIGGHQNDYTKTIWAYLKVIFKNTVGVIYNDGKMPEKSLLNATIKCIKVSRKDNELEDFLLNILPHVKDLKIMQELFLQNLDMEEDGSEKTLLFAKQFCLVYCRLAKENPAKCEDFFSKVVKAVHCEPRSAFVGLLGVFHSLGSAPKTNGGYAALFSPLKILTHYQDLIKLVEYCAETIYNTVIREGFFFKVCCHALERFVQETKNQGVDYLRLVCNLISLTIRTERGEACEVQPFERSFAMIGRMDVGGAHFRNMLGLFSFLGYNCALKRNNLSSVPLIKLLLKTYLKFESYNLIKVNLFKKLADLCGSIYLKNNEFRAAMQMGALAIFVDRVNEYDSLFLRAKVAACSLENGEELKELTIVDCLDKIKEEFPVGVTTQDKVELLEIEIRTYKNIWPSGRGLFAALSQLVGLTEKRRVFNIITDNPDTLLDWVKTDLRELLCDLLKKLDGVTCNKTLFLLSYLKYKLLIFEWKVRYFENYNCKQLNDNYLMDHEDLKISTQSNNWSLLFKCLETLEQIQTESLDFLRIILEMSNDFHLLCLKSHQKRTLCKALELCTKPEDKLQVLATLVELDVSFLATGDKLMSKVHDKTILGQYLVSKSFVVLPKEPLEACKLYKRAEELLEEPSTINQTRLNLLHAKLLQVPCNFNVPLDHQEHFVERLNSASKIIHKSNCKKIDYWFTIGLMFDVSEALSRNSMEFRDPREGSGLGTNTILTIHKFKLSLRFCRFLLILANCDLQRLRLDDARVKLGTLFAILGVQEKVPVEEQGIDLASNSASPVLQSYTLKMPDFVQHDETCSCVYCSTEEIQQLVLEGYYLKCWLAELDNNKPRECFSTTFRLFAALKRKGNKSFELKTIHGWIQWYYSYYCDRCGDKSKALLINEQLLYSIDKMRTQNLYAEALLQRLGYLTEAEEQAPLLPVPPSSSDGALTPQNLTSEVKIFVETVKSPQEKRSIKGKRIKFDDTPKVPPKEAESPTPQVKTERKNKTKLLTEKLKKKGEEDGASSSTVDKSLFLYSTTGTSSGAVKKNLFVKFDNTPKEPPKEADLPQVKTERKNKPESFTERMQKIIDALAASSGTGKKKLLTEKMKKKGEEDGASSSTVDKNLFVYSTTGTSSGADKKSLFVKFDDTPMEPPKEADLPQIKTERKNKTELLTEKLKKEEDVAVASTSGTVNKNLLGPPLRRSARLKKE